MEKQLDTIRFDYRQEVQEIMLALTEWKKEHPTDSKVDTVKVAIALLDNMDMCW